MQRLRTLGNIERGCWLIDQTAPMNVVAVAEVRGQLRLARLREALDWVQRRHPLLRVCVQTEAGVPAYFAGNTMIPIEVLTRRNADHWQQVAIDERNRPLRWDTPPLARMTVLHGDDKSDLVITLHHLISDGVSSVYFFRDLLLALSGHTSDDKLAPLSARPSLELLMPPAERGITGLKRSARFIGQQAWTYFAERPQLLPEQQHVPAAQRRSSLSHQRLTSAETTALLDASREHGVTVHSVLCAALLMAVGAEIHAESPAPDQLLGCCTPVNLRRALSPAVGEDLGLYVGPIVTFHRLAASTQLFALAEQVTSQIHAARAAGVPTLALATQSRLLPARISPQRAAQHLYNRLFGTVSVSNMGVLEIPTDYGELHLHALHIGGSNNPYGSLISITVTTLAAQMSLTFNYNERIVSAERLRRVVTATMHKLR